ncbi:helix-turn-helix domain-containing protein [Companilactobacillus sp. HBUAS59699]|uniref:helix-turn-helix domain-containing protein n=1 Tax=Companilactobacillus sp. HBUAS59699 TaxID=3109358 RepID=UPI002FF1C4F6
MLIDNIKRYAKLRGLSLKQTAIKAGMSENTIYGWKNHEPSKGSIMAVAKTLGVTYEDLTGIKEKKTPTKVDVKAAIDDKDVLMTFDGKPIPPEDLELIKRLLEK